MNQKNIRIIKELKEKLQRKFNFVSELILFGSQATENAAEFSDYDILIIVSHPLSWQQQREIVDDVYFKVLNQQSRLGCRISPSVGRNETQQYQGLNRMNR